MTKGKSAAFFAGAAVYLPAAIIAAGVLLRIISLASFPPGLNQDEASAGYEAWALLNYGIDRAGSGWPVLFTAWGSGQNVLYSYLAMPFIALMGLNETALRLPAALLGCGTLPLFYFAAKHAAGKKTALWMLAALSFNPWHITISRWALESNILPFFLLLGLFLLMRAEERPICLPCAAAAFALGLYAYGTAFIFLPFFLVAAGAVLLKRKSAGARTWIVSAAVFVLIALPVTLCNIRNAAGMGEMKLLWMTLPRLTQTRQSETMAFSGGNFVSLLRLLVKQNDGLLWNSPGRFGQLYGLPGLVLAALGTAQYIYELCRKKAPKGEVFVFLALCSCFAASFFIRVNVNRMNMIFLPLIWFQGRGLRALGRIRFVSLPAAAALLASAALFAGFYFGAYAGRLSPLFFEGLGDAIKYSQEQDGEIWISTRVNMPYIYALFYTRTPPADFIESAEFIDPDSAFRHVRSFGRFRFGDTPAEGAVYIAPAGTEWGRELARFDNYIVARG